MKDEKELKRLMTNTMDYITQLEKRNFSLVERLEDVEDLLLRQCDIYDVRPQGVKEYFNKWHDKEQG